jgi:hypothetical protein
MLVIGATGHRWRVVVCGLASLDDAPASAELAMVVEAAIRRLPSALPLRFADYDDACALKEGDDMVDGAASNHASQRQHHRGTRAHPARDFHTRRQYRGVCRHSISRLQCAFDQDSRRERPGQRSMPAGASTVTRRANNLLQPRLRTRSIDPARLDSALRPRTASQHQQAGVLGEITGGAVTFSTYGGAARRDPTNPGQSGFVGALWATTP